MKTLMKVFVAIIIAMAMLSGCAGPTRIYIPYPPATGMNIIAVASDTAKISELKVTVESPKKAFMEVRTYDPRMLDAAGVFLVNYANSVRGENAPAQNIEKDYYYRSYTNQQSDFKRRAQENYNEY